MLKSAGCIHSNHSPFVWAKIQQPKFVLTIYHNSANLKKTKPEDFFLIFYLYVLNPQVTLSENTCALEGFPGNTEVPCTVPESDTMFRRVQSLPLYYKARIFNVLTILKRELQERAWETIVITIAWGSFSIELKPSSLTFHSLWIALYSSQQKMTQCVERSLRF